MDKQNMQLMQILSAIVASNGGEIFISEVSLMNCGGSTLSIKKTPAGVKISSKKKLILPK